MSTSMDLAVTWQPMVIVLTILVVGFAALVFLSGRRRFETLLMPVGFVLGLLAVYAAASGSGHPTSLPLSVLGAALLISGAILRTRSPEKT